MPYSIRSRAWCFLGVALGVAVAAMAAARHGEAQETREIGRYGCSVHAAAREPDTTDADADAERHADGNLNRKRPEFSVREVLDLELRAWLRTKPQASRRVQLKLYTPTGHLYQVLPMVIVETASGDESAAPRHRRRRFHMATATLPLAGTTIVNSSLYGGWKALAFVEGSHEPCSPPYHFVIDP